MENTSTQTLSNIRRPYRLALLIIAGLVIISMIALQWMLSKQNDDAYIINIAGMQRMLSQKIALNVERLRSRPLNDLTREIIINELIKASDKFWNNHLNLQFLDADATTPQLPRQLPDELQKLYYSGGFPLDAKVKEYYQASRELIRVMSSEQRYPEQLIENYFNNNNVERLLQHLDQAVKHFEQQANYRVKQLRWAEYLIVFIIIIVLLLESSLIFKPMEQAISKSMLKLRLAKERAELDSRVKAHFLSTMSHELKAPINGILGMLDLALDSLEHHSKKESLTNVARINPSKETLEKAKDFVLQADIASKHLLSIISNILDYSDIENDTLLLASDKFDLCTRLELILSSVSDLAAYNKCHISRDIDKSLGQTWIIADKDRLSRIVLEVLRNAVQFSPNSDVVFSAKLERTPEQSRVVISVVDHGIGMTEYQLTKVMTPFFQVESAKPTEHQGIGLGLSLANKLTELMGGSISLDSKLGQGTEVTLNLPVDLVDTADMLRQQDSLAVDTTAGATNQTSSSLSALIVEDNSVNATLLKSYLNNLEFTTTHATDGRVAVELCKNNSYDFIFMDINMPNMDGIEAARVMREQLSITAPIIAVTANTGAKDKAAIYEVGMNDVIGKPVDKQLLSDLVRKWR
ncbi:MAG: response regulator [Kangiellaceae bacterium]|jgi:signal transduction histidine kinase/CheY-like chemotaxis protein|nr:response regulator [Kangiellaceae bacterium]